MCIYVHIFRHAHIHCCQYIICGKNICICSVFLKGIMKSCVSINQDESLGAVPCAGNAVASLMSCGPRCRGWSFDVEGCFINLVVISFQWDHFCYTDKNKCKQSCCLWHPSQRNSWRWSLMHHDSWSCWLLLSNHISQPGTPGSMCYTPGLSPAGTNPSGVGDILWWAQAFVLRLQVCW